VARVLVRVFEHEPELLSGLPRREAEKALEAAVAPMTVLEPGDWRPPLVRLRAGDLGLLILDGLIIRRTDVMGRTGVELVGAGDVARPWKADEEDVSLPSRLSVEVPQRTLVAVLDAGFVTTIARWPEILPQILERMSTRARSLAIQLAIARLSNLEDRLHWLLWHLADRWGHVDREGVVLRLRLSQRVLADLTSATRPSVSTALGRLRARGLVARTGWKEYRLYGAPPDELDGLPSRARGTRSTSRE
jgi:CRP/FNR family cyclic AMP-dependent transcriptional regulator